MLVTALISLFIMQFLQPHLTQVSLCDPTDSTKLFQTRSSEMCRGVCERMRITGGWFAHADTY